MVVWVDLVGCATSNIRLIRECVCVCVCVCVFFLYVCVCEVVVGFNTNPKATIMQYCFKVSYGEGDQVMREAEEASKGR